MDRAERERLLDRLKESIEQNKALFEGAKLHLEESRNLQDLLGPTHPDGSLAQALKIYAHTQANYRKALMRYNRFVLDGTLPED